MYSINAEGYLHAGYNFSGKSELSMYLGFSAIQDYHHIIPISIRYTTFYKQNSKGDRWFSLVDVGSGFSIKERPEELISGKIGGGYRISLSKDTKLDFIVSLRSVLTHPDIIYYGTEIPADKVNRNNAYVSAISFSMALTL